MKHICLSADHNNQGPPEKGYFTLNVHILQKRFQYNLLRLRDAAPVSNRSKKVVQNNYDLAYSALLKNSV